MEYAITKFKLIGINQCEAVVCINQDITITVQIGKDAYHDAILQAKSQNIKLDNQKLLNMAFELSGRWLQMTGGKINRFRLLTKLVEQSRQRVVLKPV